MASLNGAKVLVIGGASGVGYAVAAAALEAGAEVVVGSSRAPRVEAAVGKLGRGAAGWAVDVRDETSVAAFFDAAGRFDQSSSGNSVCRRNATTTASSASVRVVE